MSGYFEALMRSSSIGGRAPVVAHASSPAIEGNAERAVGAMPPDTVQRKSQRQETVARTFANPVGQSTAPISLTAASDAHEVQAGVVGAEQVPAPRDADPPEEPPVRAIETSKQPLGHAVVRATMQWVAADTQPVRGVAPVIQPREGSVPALDKETSLVTTAQEPRYDPVEAQPQATSVPQANPVGLEARGPAVVHALPIRSARPPTMPPVSVEPLAHDEEMVEISIGAIHVRVDSPAAQTVARPVATPSVSAPPAGAAFRPRSALSRRALRRI